MRNLQTDVFFNVRRNQLISKLRQNTKIAYSFVNWAEHAGRFCIEVWPDVEFKDRHGHWDMEAWEASKSFIEPLDGVDLRTAWKEAWRELRVLGRNFGGLEFCECRDECPVPLPGIYIKTAEAAVTAPADAQAKREVTYA